MSDEPTKTDGSIQPPGQKGFLWDLWKSMKDRTGTYIITFVFAILTIFSDSLAGRIKFAINRADLREDRYATFSRQLSNYIFLCELMEEYLANGWTTREGLTPILIDYNASITDLRKNEYANRALLSRYWSKERSREFEEVMKEIRVIDSAMHELNDEFEQVNIKKTKDKVDPAKARTAAERFRNLLAKFKPETEKLLGELE